MVDEITLDEFDPAAFAPPEEKKRRGRSTGTDKAPTRTRQPRVNIAQEIGRTVNLLNGLVVMTPFAGDALTQAESDLLIEALTAEAEGSAKAKKLLRKLAVLGPHMLLMRALTLIAVPRLAAHGMLPPNLTGMFSDDNTDALRPEGFIDPTVPMEAGRAYGGDWGHRDGEIHANGDAPASEEAYDYSQIEGR